MAIDTSIYNTSSIKLVAFNSPIKSNSSPSESSVFDSYHDWIQHCWKNIITDKNGKIKQIEYHFPDEVVIHQPSIKDKSNDL